MLADFVFVVVVNVVDVDNDNDELMSTVPAVVPRRNIGVLIKTDDDDDDNDSDDDTGNEDISQIE